MIAEKEYKDKTNCTEEQAKVAITYFNFINEKAIEASKCPKCSGKLYFEGGSYEEGYGDFIACEECDFTSDVEGIYEYLGPWYGFDPCLYAPEMFNHKSRKEEMEKITKERLQEMKLI
jgi:hypothetical protein